MRGSLAGRASRRWDSLMAMFDSAQTHIDDLADFVVEPVRVATRP